MFQKNLFIFYIIFASFKLAFAGFIFQDFENKYNTPNEQIKIENFAASLNSKLSLTKNIGDENLFSNALKVESIELWNSVEIEKKEDITDVSNIDRLSFKIRALPANKTNNNVGVTFFDKNKYLTTGFEIWTNFTTIYDKWVRLDILFSELPSDFDIKSIFKIKITNYWQGTYYIDDINLIRDARVLQSFEIAQRSGATIEDFGWFWNKDDKVILSNKNEPAYEGEHSLKIISKDNWGGAGIKSEYKTYTPFGKEKHTYWHIEFNAPPNDRLLIHIYPLPTNKEDIFFHVHFFDYEKHAEEENKIVVLTKEKAVFGKWNTISIPFSSLANTLNLHDINKIQIQFYYPGTYYIDDIKITGPIPEMSLLNNTLFWNHSEKDSNPAYNLFQLEFSKTNEKNSWVQVYRGTKKSYTANEKGYYRVRYELLSGFKNGVSYFSEWNTPLQVG